MTAAEPARRAAEPAPDLDAFRADRVYLGADHVRNERRTWIVAGLCAVALAVQIAAGVAFKSMALIAGGLHMAAHVAALLVAALAYALARKYAKDDRFSFGTGKLGYLAGFANAVLLAATALIIAIESAERMLAPEEVVYRPALLIAAAGLVFNLICMGLLRPRRAARTDAPDADLNLSAAYLHLGADAAVSGLAIAGLAAGWALGWGFADPLAGLLGAGLVAHFAWSLLRRAGAALLDINPSRELTAEVRRRLEADGSRVRDLHLWRLGPGHHAAVAVVAAAKPASPDAYRARLADLPGLSHVTIEVGRL